MKKTKKTARLFDGKRPTVIRTPFPTVERVARVFGMSKKRVKRVERIVAEAQKESKKEEALLREALKKLNRDQRRQLWRFIKSEYKSARDLHEFLFGLREVFVNR